MIKISKYMFLVVIAGALAIEGCSGNNTDESPRLETGTNTVSIKGHIERKEVVDVIFKETNTIWVLNLNIPVTVEATSFEDENDIILYEDVKSMQMNLTGDQYKKWGDLVGADIIAHGMLYRGHSAHHFTDILIDMQDITKNTGD
jgi:transcriptional regulator of nitric oxide reductase